MLNKNFRQLISFYTGGSFTNVNGNTIARTEYLGGQGYNLTTNDYSNPSYVKNGHEWRGSCLSYDYNPTDQTNICKGEKTLYNWSQIVSQLSNVSSVYASLLFNGFVIFVGDGTTAPTADDYCLANAVELDVISAYCNTNAYNKTFVSRTFANNTESDVTIKEVGCYVFRTMSTTGASIGATPIVMIGRIVLPEPVTIAVGEQKTFTYCIDLGSINLG